MKTTTTLALAAVIGLAACSEPAETGAATEDMAMADETAVDAAAPSGTIVALAQGNANLSTLVEAVQAADLGETLSGGPYTVFAPNDAAFAKLPEGALANLVANDKERLGAVIEHHVVDGEAMATDLIEAIGGASEEGYTITTLGGGTLTARMVGGKVTLTDEAGNTATVVKADVPASNGVIHIVDTVLMPE